MKCSKCNGEMEPGFIPGIGRLFGTISVWINKANYSKLPLLSPRKSIMTYRCKECGFLESYAQ